jgi:hypothetical protein
MNVPWLRRRLAHEKGANVLAAQFLGGLLSRQVRPVPRVVKERGATGRLGFGSGHLWRTKKVLVDKRELLEVGLVNVGHGVRVGGRQRRVCLGKLGVEAVSRARVLDIWLVARG